MTSAAKPTRLPALALTETAPRPRAAGSLPVRMMRVRPAPMNAPTSWAAMYVDRRRRVDLARRQQGDRHRRVDVAAADVADRVDGGEDREGEGERDRRQLGAAERVAAGQEHRQRHGARADEHQDRGADRLGGQLLGQGRVTTSTRSPPSADLRRSATAGRLRRAPRGAPPGRRRRRGRRRVRVISAPGRIVRPSSAMRLFTSAVRSPTLDRDPALEPAGRPDDLGGRAGVESRGIEDASGAALPSSVPRHLWHRGRPAAASATSSSDAPTLAWTAARTAPSTSGASLTRTRARSSSSSSSSASSRLSAALPEIEQDEDPVRARIECRADRGGDPRGARPEPAVLGPPAVATGTSVPADLGDHVAQAVGDRRAVRDEDETDQSSLLSIRAGEATDAGRRARQEESKEPSGFAMDARRDAVRTRSSIARLVARCYTRPIRSRQGLPVSVPSPSSPPPRRRPSCDRRRGPPGCAPPGPRAVDRHAAALTRLDAVLGDGDHGDNLSTGFRAVEELLDELPPDTPPGELMRAVGHRLVATVGGASGPLYGTAFIEAGLPGRRRGVARPAALAEMLEAAAAGLARRGRCASATRRSSTRSGRPRMPSPMAVQAGGSAR